MHKVVGGAWTKSPLQLLGLCVFTQRSQVHNGFLHAFLATAVGLQGDQRFEVEPRVAMMRRWRRQVRVDSARRLRPGLPVEAAADVI